MRNLLNVNNPVMLFIGRILDAVILNLLWIICCIPVVTFGPATIAFHYTMMKDVKDEAPRYVQTFFKAFKENMRCGIPLGMFILIFSALSGYAIFFYANNQTTGILMLILKWLVVGLTILFVCALQYVFALASRFENTTMATFRNAVFISLKNLGWTLAMILIFFLPLWIIYTTEFIPMLLFGYGLVVYADAFILNKIIDPLVKKALKDQGKEEDGEVIDDEEGRYSEEELLAASQWQIPKGLSASSYAAPAEKETVPENNESTAAGEDPGKE